MDLTRIGEYGREGILLLMCESTNVDHPGFTPSEKRVGASLDLIFMTNTEKRIIIATFSSNVHRVQQLSLIHIFSPVQVEVLPVSNAFNDYGAEVAKKLDEAGIRVHLDDRNEKIGYKIREAQLQKTPYMLVVGEREKDDGTVSVLSLIHILHTARGEREKLPCSAVRLM